MGTETVRNGAKAMALLEALGVAPSPEAYTVAFRHAENPTGPVARAVEEALLSGTMDDAAIHGVYLREVEQRRTEAMAAVNAASQAGADESLGVVTRAEESTLAFMEGLSEARAGLAAAVSHEAALAVAANLSLAVSAMAEEQRAARKALAEVRMRLSDLQGRYEQALDEARSDPLTNLRNRRAFEQHLATETRRSDLSGIPLSVLVLDIDRFKAINDTYGHAAGDGVIKAVAATLRMAVRAGDVAARIGGEEFAVLLAGSDGANAARVAERIRAQIQSLRLRDVRGMDPSRSFTVSVGVAQFEPGEDGAAALARADDNLYEAKRSGRNRVVAGPRVMAAA